MTTTHYAYQGDRFYRVELDGQGTIVGTPTEVSADEAVPHLVDEFTAGTLVRSTLDVTAGAPQVPQAVGDADFAEGVLIPAFEQVFNGGGTLDERFAHLHELYGDNPDVVRLVTQRLGEDIAGRIWSPAVVARYGQNDLPPDVPTPAPADVIQGSRSQGVGPLPPPPAPEASGDGSKSFADSGGQGTASSPRDDGRTGGDPLVLSTGQLYHQVTDLAVAGRGLHFAFTRTYLNQMVYKGPLGCCWDHSYNLWLREAQETLPDGTLQNVVYRSTGQLREDRYVQQVEPDREREPLAGFADATFSGPPGFFDRLEKSSGRYVLQMPAGVRVEYNRDLLAERIVDLNDNAITLEYDSGRLTLVRDPVGKEFVFGYDDLNRIVLLHDRTGDRRVAFSYGSNGDLEEADLLMPPDLVAGTDYRYLGPDAPPDLQHNLVEVIDPCGRSLLDVEYSPATGTWEYNRVVRQRAADGQFTYAYGPVTEPDTDPALEPVHTPQRFTQVTYPNGHLVEHQFNEQGNVVQRIEKVARPGSIADTLVARYRYNADGLIVDEELPDGSGASYYHEREAYEDLHGGDATDASPTEQLTFGNLLRRIERPRRPSGDLRRIVTDYTYRPGGNRIASQRGPYYADAALNELPGQQTSEIGFGYDTRGNLTRIDYPQVVRPDGTVQVPAPTEYDYDAHGSVAGVTVDAVATTYRHFDDPLRSGFVREKVDDPGGAARTTTYDSDDLGRITGVTDPDGARWETDWTTFDAPRQARMPPVAPDAPPTAVTYTYDRARRLVSAAEDIRRADGSPHPDGPATQHFRYDAYGRLVEHSAGTAAAPRLRVLRAAFEPDGMRRLDIDARGTIRRYGYDVRRLLRSVTDGWSTSESVTERYRYDQLGQLAEAVDGRGFVSGIERDAFGRPDRLVDASGNEVEIEYDAADRPTRQRLRGRHPVTGRQVLWSDAERRYDRAGRLVQRIDYLFDPGTDAASTPLRTWYWYDALNRLTGLSDGTKMLSHYRYDGLGRLTHLRDADGNETTFHYDDAGRTLRVDERETGRDANGTVLVQAFTRTVELDARGLPVAETDGLGNTTRRRFDSRRLLESVVDPAGHRSDTEYDVFGSTVRQRTTVAGATIDSILSYDENGNPVTLTTPAGGTTTWTYDALNRVSSVDRSGARSTFTYDGQGNVLRQTDPNGTVTHRVWTATGLLAEERVDAAGFAPPAGAPGYTPGPTSVARFTHTPLGSTAMAENAAARTDLSYDSLGRLLAETTDGRTVAYRYDTAGHRTALIYPGQREIRFDYSPGGALTAIRQTAPGVAYPGPPAAAPARTLTEIHRIGSRPHQVQFGSSHAALLRYDAAKQVVGLDWSRLADGSPLLVERSLYGPRGEWRLWQVDSGARLAGYNDLRRLVRADDYQGIAPVDVLALAPGDTPGQAPFSGQADADALVAAVAAAAAGASHERSFTYQIDANTNRLATTTRLAAGGTMDTTLYLPDPGDRYRSIGGAATVHDRAGNLVRADSATFRYDGQHRLVEATSGGATTTIGYDALGRPVQIGTQTGIDELIFAASRIVEWRRGGITAGQVVPLERPHQFAHLASDGKDYAPLTDRMDSVLAWLAPDGTVAGRSTYDPFGQVLDRGPVWPAPIGYAGFWHGPDDLYLLSARTYSARLGRFLQPDPAGLTDGTNIYAYAHHAPGTLVDHFGLSSTDINWGTVAWEATKTIAVGAGVIVGAGALVGAGVVSAPFVLAIGAGLLVVGGISSYTKRSVDAIHAGRTDYEGRAAIAALGDTVGVTNIVEGITGGDAVTDRVLGSEERSNRLGTGIGTTPTVLLGSRLVGAGSGIGKSVAARTNPYTIPSIARPTYRNPIVVGRYQSPQGVVWEGNVFRGVRDGFRSWRSGDGWTTGWRGGAAHGGGAPARYYEGAGSYWHSRSHFGNWAGRPGAHSYFDPAFGRNMVQLADAPYIAARGGHVDVSGLEVNPGNISDIRARVFGGGGGNPDRGGAFVWNLNAPRIGAMGGNPGPQLAPAGTPLSNGYRVIVEGDGVSQVVNLVTMYPQ